MSSEPGTTNSWPQQTSSSAALSSHLATRPTALDRPGSHGSTLSSSTASSTSTGGSSSGAKLPRFLLRSSSKKGTDAAKDGAGSSSSSKTKADRGSSSSKLASRRRRQSDDASVLDKLPSTAEGAVEDDPDGGETASLSPSVATTSASWRTSGHGGGHSRQSTVSQIDFEPEEILMPAASSSSSQRAAAAAFDNRAATVPARKASRTKTLRKKTSKLFSTKDRSSSSHDAPAPGPTAEASPSPSPALELPQAGSMARRSSSPSSTVSSEPVIVVDAPLQGLASPPTSMRRPVKGQQARSRPGSTASTDSASQQHPAALGGFYQQPQQQAGSAVRIHEMATALPNRLGGWLSNLLPSHQQPSSSPPSSSFSGGPSTATPIPPSLHATSSPPRAPAGSSGSGSQGQRSFVAAAREKGALTRYFLDSDARRPERNTENIWLMGRRHDGWRPDEPSAAAVDNGSPAERPSGLPLPPPPPPPQTTTANGGAVGSPQRKTSSAPSSNLSSSTSPGRFTNLFAGSSISLIGNVGGGGGDESSPRRGGKKEDVRWPADFYEDFRTSVWCTYRSQYAAFAALPPHLLTPPPSAYDADGLPTPAFLAASKSHTAAEPPIPRVQSGWAWVKNAGGADDKGLTTDSGWGCMLRTGQTLLANGLIHHHLGRDWRRPETPPSADAPAHEIRDYATYVRILSWFLDDPLPFAPFSVHRMALVGKQLGKEVGEWFGPSTAAGAIRTLVGAYPHAGVAVSVAADSVIVRSDVFAASQPAAAPADSGAASLGRKSAAAAAAAKWGSRPVLVLVGIRLGLDGVNPIYHDSVRDLFTFPQSLGIAGGRPSSSYYFLGFQGDALIYLDPHHTRPAVALNPPPARDDLFAHALSASTLGTPAGSDPADSASLSPSPDVFSSPAAPPPRPTSSFRPARGPSPSPSRPVRADSPGFSPSPSHRASPPTARAEVDPLAAWFASAYAPQALQSYHCDKVRKMSFGQLDPSMLLGFLCKDEADWNDFRSRVANMPHPIFSISDEASSWDDDDDVGLESFSETDPESASDAADDRESLGGLLSRRSSDELDDDVGQHGPAGSAGADEGEAEHISKEEATAGGASPFVLQQHARMPSASFVDDSLPSTSLESASSQATPQFARGPAAAAAAASPATARRPSNSRALGSEFELLDEDDWRGADSDDVLDDETDDDGDGHGLAGRRVDPTTPGSPVSKRQQRQTLADRLQASSLAFPSLGKGSDDSLTDGPTPGSANGASAAGPPLPPPPLRKTAAQKQARLRRKAGRRSISGATARPLAEEEDDDDDDWNDTL